MKKNLFLIFAAFYANLFAATPVAQFTNFTALPLTNGLPAGWSTFSPRLEIAPICQLDAKAGRRGSGALHIASQSNSDFGGWNTKVDGLNGGRTYRFVAWYKAEGITFERRSVIARLEWQDQNGKSARPPDYAIDTVKEAGWTKVEYITRIPTNASRVDIQLALAFVPRGKLWWDDIQVLEEPSPPDRKVRAVTIFCRPRGSKSPAESVNQFCQLVEKSAAEKPDLICLPEGITVIGTGKKYAEVAEPIPGPTTLRLGALAKTNRCYIVAGIYERGMKCVYNTAVLLGRQGELVGTYRKTHLPREEWEAGITPGDTYPVFQTDFGKVGLIICWDLQFPEPSRAMAAQGAEILLLPIWGGSEALAKARAIENSIFLITSSYDMRTYILDPTGQVLAEATTDQPIAAADLRLDQKFSQPWIGDMKTRAWKERRPDIKVESAIQTVGEAPQKARKNDDF